eukprot:m.100067 g.100067  ORF g.100067 m.100067 type:complete len:101 (+) comp8918_c0_seq3:678-980(+)
MHGAQPMPGLPSLLGTCAAALMGEWQGGPIFHGTHLPCRNRQPVAKASDGNGGLKRATVVMVLFIIGLITLIEILTRVRPSNSTDPLLDPRLNPHVRVED